MVQYRTNAGERRKPALGRFGELTVEQARSIAQDWLADVRKGKDPGAEKTAARDAPSVKELCPKEAPKTSSLTGFEISPVLGCQARRCDDLPSRPSPISG